MCIKTIKVKSSEDIDYENLPFPINNTIYLKEPEIMSLIKLLIYKVKEEPKTYDGFIQILKEYNGTYEFSESILEDLVEDIVTIHNGVPLDALDYVITRVYEVTGVIIELELQTTDLNFIGFTMGESYSIYSILRK